MFSGIVSYFSQDVRLNQVVSQPLERPLFENIIILVYYYIIIYKYVRKSRISTTSLRTKISQMPM